MDAKRGEHRSARARRLFGLALRRIVFAGAVLTIPFAACAAGFHEIGSLTPPTSAKQLLYLPAHNRLVLRNAGSAIALVDPTNGASAIHLSNARFTDVSLSPSGNFVFVADYGGENIGYSTPAFPSYVHRYDLANGWWEVNSVYIAGAVQPVSDTQFILKSIDQWVSFTNNYFTLGSAATQVGAPYFAGAYFGDFRYHPASGRLIHGNTGSSSQEIRAYKLVNDAFSALENSGIYGSAQGYGPNVVMATDGSAFYYGKLQVDPLDVTHNLRVFPEIIYAATGDIAFGNGNYYDAHTGMLLGTLGVQATVYGLNPNGQDFWAYDEVANLLRHFGPTAPPPGACTLTGSSVSVLAAGAASGSATAQVVNGAVEFDPAPGNPNVAVDVESASIRLYNRSVATDVVFGTTTTYRVILGAGTPASITHATAAYSGVAGLPTLAFDGQSVILTLTGTTLHPGDAIDVALQTACVPCTLDIDGDGVLDPLTDGLMLTRALSGLTGVAVTKGAVGPGAARTSWTTIRPYLNGICGANFAP